MRTALLATALLSTQAMAQSPDTSLLDDMWTAYTNWCSTTVNDPDTFYDNLDLISQGAVTVLEPSSDGDVLNLVIARPSFSFGVHVGAVGDRTFMSCGVTSTESWINAQDLAPRIETDYAAKVPDGLFIGGRSTFERPYYYDGKLSIEESPNDYQYFVDQAVPNVDTVTFIQLLDSWLSLYFHHVFEGRIGLPATTPQPIKRVP